MRTKIDCCKGCVAPKRHLYCHASCPEYTGQRKELDEANAIRNAENATGANIAQQKSEGVMRALRGGRHGK